MNWGIVLVVVGVGLAAALFAALWPYLNPESPLWARQRLGELLRTWERVRDLRATVTILRPGEPRLVLSLLYLAGGALRLELREPAELAGEVYTLRPVDGGWLFVHFRPRLELGLEARLVPAQLDALLAPTAWDKAEVRWPRENTLLLRGLAGPFTEIEADLEGEFRLPRRLVLREPTGHTVAIEVNAVEVNRGLELRELLILDPFPTRWIRIPAPPAPGA